ncbi:MAG: LysR substrate-binding domain-containing protein [Rhodothermales bacterium]
MTLIQLTYLIAVDTHRHFSKAAEHCFVSQPSLSVQLRKLEEELGVQLFDRSRTPVVPTEIGKKVISQARQVLQETARINDLVDTTKGEITGTLHVGIIPTLAPYIVPLVMPIFMMRYPNVQLTFHELLTAHVLEGLQKETLDIGLIATDEASGDTKSRFLFSEPFMAYLSDGHRLSGKHTLETNELSLDDLWLLKEGHCFRDQMLQVCSAGSQACGLHRSVLFESGNLETLQKVVDQAGGMTLMPYLATLYFSDELLAERVRPFAEPVPERRIQMVYHRADLKKHVINAFVDALLAELPTELKERVS